MYNEFERKRQIDDGLKGGWDVCRCTVTGWWTPLHLQNGSFVSDDWVSRVGEEDFQIDGIVCEWFDVSERWILEALDTSSLWDG